MASTPHEIKSPTRIHTFDHGEDEQSARKRIKLEDESKGEEYGFAVPVGSEKTVKEDWKKHRVWINKDCFYKCWSKIWQWINVDALKGQLMKHGLVSDEQDVFLIHADRGPRDRADNLLKLAEKGGKNGYHMLYICIRDCDENHCGHSDVVEELKEYAKKNHIQPLPELADDDGRLPDGHGGSSKGLQKTPAFRRHTICTHTSPLLNFDSRRIYSRPSLPTLPLLPSDPIYRFEEKLLSKELERMFLPSLNKLREKMEMEEEIATHKRHCKALKGIRDRLHEDISNSREQTIEEIQAIEEILCEKKATKSRLQSELAKLEYTQADKEMCKVRKRLDEMWKNREPVDKIELKDSWRITNTEDGKLLATIIDSKGSVALLERQGDTLLEPQELMIHRNDEDTCEWTPAGIAVDEDDIYVGDAAGAVPPGRTREQHITATTDISNQGKSKLLRFKLLQGKQVPEEQPLQVDDPSGMAFRGKSLYVCDRSKHQVTMLDCTNECTTLSHYGKKGTGDGEFRKPTAIAFDDNGNIYVLDQGNCRVQVFSPEFRFLRTFGGDELRYPAFDIHVSKEFVYVTQTELNCVSVFDKQYGIFVVSFSNEKLKHPVGIVADREGYIYVCGASNVWLF